MTRKQMDPAAVETWLQYTHLDKLYSYLPGMPAAIPEIVGIDDIHYDDLLARFANRAQQAAHDLLADPELTDVAELPFAASDHVLAVGDSITDDLQSWAEILHRLLNAHRPDSDITVDNHGLSAHTSTMILRSWPATLTNSDPDWILCALGSNDVTRVGPEPTKPQVSLAESIANLQRLRQIAASSTPRAHWVWLTPPPVIEDRVDQHPRFRFGQSTWRNDDITALTEAIHRFDDPVVDLSHAFGVPAQPDLQGADGVHVTLDGHKAIVRALLAELSAISRNGR